jgi:hypothetical protein
MDLWLQSVKIVTTNREVSDAKEAIMASIMVNVVSGIHEDSKNSLLVRSLPFLKFNPNGVTSRT